MIAYVIIAVFFSWLMVLTWVVVRTRKHYHSLVLRTRKHTIDEILDEILTKNKNNEEEIRLIKKNIEEVQKDGQKHYQKLGFVRFNPFERTGGEQSFVIAFLDAEDTGLTLNFIYTRDGLHVYSKRIVRGLAEGVGLSEEEKRAIKKSC